MNVAASADGKIDTVARRGAAISSERDRERVDTLRSSVDGVMVGGRTLHDEDPRLTIRSEALRAERVASGQPAQPAKIGIASKLMLRPDSRFLGSGPARIILFVPRGGAVPLDGVEVYEVGDDRVDLAAALEHLAALGMRRLLVEGGGTLNFELLRQGLVNELSLFVAPLVFGGATAPTLADGDGLPRELAIRLSPPQVEAWPDGGVLLRYQLEHAAEPPPGRGLDGGR